MNGLFVGKINPQGAGFAEKTAKEKASLLGGMSSKQKFWDIFSKKIKKTKKDEKSVNTIAVVNTVKNPKTDKKNAKAKSNTNTKLKTVVKEVKGEKQPILSLKSSKQISTTNVTKTHIKKQLNLNVNIKDKTDTKSVKTNKFAIKLNINTSKKSVVVNQKEQKGFSKTTAKKQHTDNKNLNIKVGGEKQGETKPLNNLQNNNTKVKVSKPLQNLSKTGKLTVENGETVKVKIVSLKKEKANLEENVNKLVDKLNLKQNQQRVQNEIKGNMLTSDKQSAVMEKLIEAIKVAQKQKPTHRAVLELEPKSLGKIEVKISYSADHKIDIQVKAENPAVKSMVESSFSSLSSFVGGNNTGGNENKRKSFDNFFDDTVLSAEEQLQIIEEIMASNNEAINIIV